MKNEFLTADEAAAATGLSPNTLRKMAWERRIRSFKVLGALRFKPEDLEPLIVERPARKQAADSESGRAAFNAARLD